MKTYISKSTVLLLLILLAFNMEIRAQDKNTEKESLKIEVNGLACPFCAYGLEKKLRSNIKNLENLDIDFKNGYVTFTYPKSNKPSEENIKKIVADAGFEVNKIVYGDKPIKKPDKK